MAKLSVNINKIATLRNARGGDTPNVLKAALDIERMGAQGITVHPRPDGRHIRMQDVFDIAKNIRVEFNIEGYPSSEFLELIAEVRPAQATLVPDPPGALTSNAGFRTWEQLPFLQDVINQIHGYGIRTSLFIDPYDFVDRDIQSIIETKTDRIELYTEAYAKAYGTAQQEKVTHIYASFAGKVKAVGIGINAGHDLNLDNLKYLVQQIPVIDEVSIGHALICDALYLGLEETIRRYLECLN